MTGTHLNIHAAPQDKSKKGGEDEDDMFKMDGDEDDAEEDSSMFKMDDDDEDDEEDELGDVDVSRLIIVTQWRSKPQPVREHSGRTGSRGVTEDLANVINDGLYYYEREVSVEVSWIQVLSACHGALHKECCYMFRCYFCIIAHAM